jgi:cytochrome c5
MGATMRNGQTSIRSRTPAKLAAVSVGLAMTIGAGSCLAQSTERSGKDVVDAVCVKCHATGVDGAPKIGDKAAWSKLEAQGLAKLTAVALSGIRKMPPHGANMQLTDTELQRAITYMVNHSGGHWVEPVSTSRPAAPRTGEQIVTAQCAKCHEKGLHNAPKIGDRDAWIPRMKNGLDVLVRSAINGHGGMPARGGVADLTDAEMKDAISYMFNKSVAAPAKK